MNRFYLMLWLRWVLRVSLCSVLLASLFSFIITLFMYVTKSSVTSMNYEVFEALFQVFWFWFSITWSLTLLIALFRSLKFIFDRCIQGYKLQLLSCDTQDIVHPVGYGDLVKVWRKWFMIIIWLVASMMVVSFGLTYVVSEYTSIFEWFNIFWLYGFVLASGYFSFIIMIAKCKRVELVKC